MSRKTKVLLLGSSGSIGESTLEVIRRHSDRFELAGLACGRRFDSALKQAAEFRPRVAVVTGTPDGSFSHETANLKAQGVHTEWLVGDGEHLATLARELDYDVCVAAITGAAGLPPVLEAARRGKRLALANKESLVMTGPLLTSICRESGAELLPVDSEHSAVFQCLRGESSREVKRIILTASGGPFRTTSKEALAKVTLEQALKHPTWQMGPKITVDSSTLFNKALEVIEARWLFDAPREKLDAIVHPQSVIHSMVEFVDHSVIAQLGPTDMKIPIQYALSFPERIEASVPAMSIAEMATLTFEPVDYERFPALRLGFEIASAGGTLGAVFNAANEVAVERFLKGEIHWLDIYRTVASVCEAHQNIPRPALEEVLEADRQARERAMAV